MTAAFAATGTGPLLLKAVQGYAWAVFLVAWAQMGWIDWKEQKIRNRYLRVWLCLVSAGYAALLAQSAAGALGWTRVFIVGDYYSALFGHLVISAAAAYALWWLRIWPAGDVKLFCLLALCYPLMRIPGSFRSGLLFLEVLINIFVPAAAFLFLTAGEYLWRTRLAIYKGHLQVRARQALQDWRFELRRQREKQARRGERARSAWAAWSEGVRTALVDGLRGARDGALSLWTPIGEDLRQTWAFYRAQPGRLLLDGFTWFAMMGVMSMISYYLNDVLSSQVLKTVVCFALMFGWARIVQYVGQTTGLAALFGGCALVLWRYPHLNVPALAVIFGHITVFSVCIWLGVQVAVKVLAGETGYALMPVLMMIPGVIPWRLLFRGVWNAVAAVAGGVWGVLAAHVPAIPGAPALPRLGLSLPVPQATVAVSADGTSLLLWAGMGLFFGLALVFVKIWDAESYKTIPVAHIERFMTPGPALIEKIEEGDPDFVEEHLSPLYADGLTGEQAEALREWCKNAGIDSVPLAPTISFANWIFMGYLLTRLLEGHVLRFIY